MANEKLTELAETTDIAADSLVYVVKDPSTVPISRKMAFSNLQHEIVSDYYNGWIPITSTDTWTPATTTDPYTITVPAGAEAVYDIGDKIRFTQAAATKYFYVIGTTDALLDVTGGTSYALTTDAITNVYYSKAENPDGFPGYFLHAPTVTSSGGAITSYTASTAYVIHAKLLWLRTYITITNNGTGSGYIICTLPVPSIIISAGVGRELVTGGKQLAAYIPGTFATMQIYNYDGTYPAATNSVLDVTMAYMIA